MKTIKHVTVLILAVMLMAPGPAKAIDFMELGDFAERYAAAWSSQDPELLASFYSPEGSLTVNDGESAIGREAIAEKARGFMEGFPDMVVEMRAVQGGGESARFDWFWRGTNTGPGGTGRPVAITGYEEWTFDENDLILESRGHYDEAEYQRQVGAAE